MTTSAHVNASVPPTHERPSSLLAPGSACASRLFERVCGRTALDGLRPRPHGVASLGAARPRASRQPAARCLGGVATSGHDAGRRARRSARCHPRRGRRRPAARTRHRRRGALGVAGCWCPGGERAARPLRPPRPADGGEPGDRGGDRPVRRRPGAPGRPHTGVGGRSSPAAARGLRDALLRAAARHGHRGAGTGRAGQRPRRDLPAVELLAPGAADHRPRHGRRRRRRQRLVGRPRPLPPLVPNHGTRGGPDRHLPRGRRRPHRLLRREGSRPGDQPGGGPVQRHDRGAGSRRGDLRRRLPRDRPGHVPGGRRGADRCGRSPGRRRVGRRRCRRPDVRRGHLHAAAVGPHAGSVCRRGTPRRADVPHRPGRDHAERPAGLHG